MKLLSLSQFYAQKDSEVYFFWNLPFYDLFAGVRWRSALPSTDEAVNEADLLVFVNNNFFAKFRSKLWSDLVLEPW